MLKNRTMKTLVLVWALSQKHTETSSSNPDIVCKLSEVRVIITRLHPFSTHTHKDTQITGHQADWSSPAGGLVALLWKLNNMIICPLWSLLTEDTSHLLCLSSQSPLPPSTRQPLSCSHITNPPLSRPPCGYICSGDIFFPAACRACSVPCGSEHPKTKWSNMWRRSVFTLLRKRQPHAELFGVPEWFYWCATDCLREALCSVTPPHWCVCIIDQEHGDLQK